MSNVILRSKTVIGAIIVALGHILHSGEWVEQTENLIFLTTAMEATGIVIAAYGARKAIAKSANGPMPVKLHWLTMVGSVLAFGFTNMEHTPAVPSPFPLSLAIDEHWSNGAHNIEGAAGDSLKYVISWKQPVDGLGKADSTVYRLKSSKNMWVWGRSTVVTAGTNMRRKTTGISDSLKLAKPVVGDSVVFTITDFVMCRKGDCSVPGGAGWKYITSWAPPPSAPSIRIETF